MDKVITIGGQKFRNDCISGVTVKRVLDVFASAGHFGFLEQNGSRLNENVFIDFETPCAYHFIPSDSTVSPLNRVDKSNTKLLDINCVNPAHSISSSKNEMHRKKLYRVIELEAAKDKLLIVHKIEIYDNSGANVSKYAWLQSSGAARNTHGDVLCREEMVVNEELRDRKYQGYRSDSMGGWIRLIFPEGTTVSKVIIKNSLDEGDVLMHAKVKLRTVNEHFICTRNARETLHKSPETVTADTIEVKASNGRPLHLNKLDVYDNVGSNVVKRFGLEGLLQLETSGICATGLTNMSADELLCKTDEPIANKRFEITEKGAWLRIKFPHPINICTLNIDGKGTHFKGVVVSLMMTKNTREFNCTDKPVQEFDV